MALLRAVAGDMSGAEAEAQGVVCARTRDLQVSLPVLYVGLLQYFGEFCTEIPERTI